MYLQMRGFSHLNKNFLNLFVVSNAFLN